MTEPSEIPWGLLERVVGDAFREFMFMGESNGIVRFKHIWTRRYLNVDRDGKTYRYTVSGDEPIPVIDALRHVLS